MSNIYRPESDDLKLKVKPKGGIILLGQQMIRNAALLAAMPQPQWYV